MPKQKSHRITITVSFDKPVSGAAAVRAVRNNIANDKHYAALAEERDGWSRMTVRAAAILAPAAR